jgi:hypothetical protein
MNGADVNWDQQSTRLLIVWATATTLFIGTALMLRQIIETIATP